MRKELGLSQQDLAERLSISRSKLNSYERGVQPPFDIQIQIADTFNTSLDALIRYDLSSLSPFQLSQIKSGYDVDVTGQKLRLLTISVNDQNQELIEMVSDKAKAGYSEGYGDPSFIEDLPRFSLPFLPKGKTYRCFQISGDSMLPIKSGSWITASYIDDWTNIPDGTACIVVTKDEGIVFKRVYVQIKESHNLQLVSSNPLFKPYLLPLTQILEVWKFETFNGFNYEDN